MSDQQKPNRLGFFNSKKSATKGEALQSDQEMTEEAQTKFQPAHQSIAAQALAEARAHRFKKSKKPLPDSTILVQFRNCGDDWFHPIPIPADLNWKYLKYQLNDLLDRRHDMVMAEGTPKPFWQWKLYAIWRGVMIQGVEAETKMMVPSDQALQYILWHFHNRGVQAGDHLRLDYRDQNAPKRGVTELEAAQQLKEASVAELPDTSSQLQRRESIYSTF